MVVVIFTTIVHLHHFLYCTVFIFHIFTTVTVFILFIIIIILISVTIVTVFLKHQTLCFHNSLHCHLSHYFHHHHHQCLQFPHLHDRIVKSTSNKNSSNSFRNGKSQIPTNTAKVTNMIKTVAMRDGNVPSKMIIKNKSKIACGCSFTPSLPAPSLWSGFTRDIWSVIAQDNCIPDILFKISCWNCVPKTPPGWVGWGVTEWINFLGSSWNFPNFWPLKLQSPPPRWGGG